MRSININDPKYFNPKGGSLDLHSQNINHQDIQEIIIPFLNEHPEITKLNLAGNCIGGEGAKLLATSKTLSSIDLSNNRIGSDGAKCLAEALKINSALHSIELGENRIGDEGAKYLAEALKVNNTLQSIDLMDTSIGKGVEYVAEALKINNTLKSIHLGYNNIGAEWAKYLAEALKINNALQSINFRGNLIDINGAKYLAEALIINNTLQSIDLMDNSIGDKGAEYLAETLKINVTLAFIDLRENLISDPGAEYLAEALKINTKLQAIDLCWNHIGAEGAKYLAKALEINTTLQSIDLEFHSTGIEWAKYLTEALVFNYTLQQLSGIYRYTESIDKKYIERNRKIALCLEPLKSFTLTTGIDGENIAKAIVELTALFPELISEENPLDDGHFISQQYRLLNALGHMTCEDNFEDVLNCLLPPFSNSTSQAIADLALAISLYNAHNYFVNKTIAEEELRWCMVLYGLRNELHKPELRLFACNALFKLQHPESEATLERIYEIANNTALLSYQQMLNIVNRALVKQSPENPLNEYEVELLNSIKEHKGYEPLVVSYLYQSPAFMKELRCHYPEKKGFIVIEQCILSKKQTIINQVPEKLPEVTKELLNQYNINTVVTNAFATALNFLRQELLALLNPKLEDEISEEPQQKIGIEKYSFFFNLNEEKPQLPSNQDLYNPLELN